MQSKVFAKLNLKDQSEILVLNAPASFESELAKLGTVGVRRNLSSKSPVGFALVFVTQQSEVDRLASPLAKLAPGDAVVWLAYPKTSSKRFATDLGRDTGWQAMGAAGFEVVRLVAIDEDWSAKRFRRAEFIKSMTRDSGWAMTKVGKARTKKS